MGIERILPLSGPNVWSRAPVLEIRLEPERGSASAEGSLTAIRDRVRTWRQDPSGDAPALFAELAQEFQTLAGTPVSRFWVEDRLVALEFIEEPIARLATQFANSIVWGTDQDLPDPGQCIAALRTCAREACFGATTGPVVAAAMARGIPVMRLDQDCLVQLGQGARQRRIQGVITSRSGFLAEAVSRDKLLTKTLLEQVGLPIARGRLASDPEDAWSAAKEIGPPVVIKPRDADYANGVSVNLMTKPEIVQAWELARSVRGEVLVEQQLAGVPHRLFIVDGRLVGAARRDPAQVVGDGLRNVAELIAEANRDPRRGEGENSPWYPIIVNEMLRAALDRQGLELGSIPARGRTVVLQRDPRTCQAEMIQDVTELVHPDTAQAAIDAVRIAGLDVAGVDLMAEDISQPLEEQRGGILEVNAGPAIYLHRRPMCSPARPVVEAVLESLFPPGQNGRIPIMVVVGDRAAEAALDIANGIRQNGMRVGLAARNGVRVDGRVVSRKRSDNFRGCRALLLHPSVDVAVCELSLSSIRNEGLAFEHCDLVLLAGNDDLRSLDEPRDRERCLRVLTESAPRLVWIEIHTTPSRTDWENLSYGGPAIHGGQAGF